MTTNATPAADTGLPGKTKTASTVDLELAVEAVERACAVMSIVEDAVLSAVSDETKKGISPSWWKSYVWYVLTEEQDNAIHEAMLYVHSRVRELREVHDAFIAGRDAA